MKIKNINISDVSKLAGVSVATVSRVINATCYVAPATKEKVNDAIKQLAYKPNLSARNLRKQISGAILIVTPNISNPYYGNIITGITETARKSGNSTFVCTTNNELELELEFMKMLDSKRADGAIVLATNADDTHWSEYAKKYPVVFCSEYNPEAKIDHISIDNYQAGYDAMEYLLKKGLKNIWLMSSSNKYISTKLREEGFIAAALKYGIKNANKKIIKASNDYSFASAKKIIKKLIESGEKIDGLFCISDILALGSLSMFKELSVRVPEDVSVFGFDNLEYAQMADPQISTVHQPCYELGSEAMLMIQSKLKKVETAGNKILKHKLVLRESVI
ncbi:MAG: LacI family DNA-binding transcriptional regulator [Erysipelotrichaceae bacterium]